MKKRILYLFILFILIIIISYIGTKIFSTTQSNITINNTSKNSYNIINNDIYNGLSYEKEFNTKKSNGNTLIINIKNNSNSIPVRATIYKSNSKDITKTIEPNESYSFTYKNDTLIGGIWEKFKVHTTDYDDNGDNINITINAQQFNN